MFLLFSHALIRLKQPTVKFRLIKCSILYSLFFLYILLEVYIIVFGKCYHIHHQWQRRQHKRYGTITHCCRQINYDVKHGVTNKEVQSFLQKIRLDSSYSSTQNNVGSIGRLDDLEMRYMPATEKGYFY